MKLNTEDKLKTMILPFIQQAFSKTWTSNKDAFCWLRAWPELHNINVCREHHTAINIPLRL